MSTSDRPTTPPTERIIAAGGLVLTNAIAMLTELAAIGCAGWLLSTGKLSESNFMMITGGALFGPAISKARGVPAVSSIILAMAVIPPSLLATAKGKGLLGLIVFGMSACV